MNNSGSLKSTLAVSLNNYLDAGAIVAGASGLTLWKEYLNLEEIHLGWLNALSANALGAAIGVIIGGFLADKFGRKFIFTYNLLVYMLGVLIIMCTVNFPMLLAGFLVTGISVGIGVPASWTYISESSENNKRGRNICISQMSWGFGPMIILLFGMLFAPGGYFYAPVESLAYSIVGTDASKAVVEVFSSRVVFFTLFVVALVAWNLQRQLQESTEFTSTKSKDKSGIVDNIKLLFSNKTAVKTVCFLASIYLTWNLVASVMGFFQPHIYETVYRKLSVKVYRTVSAEDEGIMEISSGENIIESTEMSERNSILLNKIKELGEPDTSIIIKQYYYNMTVAEIGKAISMTAAAVQKRSVRARQKLKNMLCEVGINY